MDVERSGNLIKVTLSLEEQSAALGSLTWHNGRGRGRVGEGFYEAQVVLTKFSNPFVLSEAGVSGLRQAVVSAAESAGPLLKKRAENLKGEVLAKLGGIGASGGTSEDVPQ